MANGSLDARLYPHAENGLSAGSLDLCLLQRVNICSDIAQGMAYLHHHSPVKVIHCDLRPRNVLLNDDMIALVSDFGIARLVMTVEAASNGGMIENMGNSTANMLCGSISYIAPEYGFRASTSTKGDVYSFGVLVLEMVTRKRPTDDMFVAAGQSLHKYVKNHYIVRLENVVDHSLLRALRDQSREVMRMWEVAIGELIELGLLCTQESASMRPTMLDRLCRRLGSPQELPKWRYHCHILIFTRNIIFNI
ncbi:Leucine-rich receptor-like protein kinase family protein [Perilla frutescens var. hirtella]|uniref:non-specific serine/threonine protein kinase n=1 Tax=Perilla frutescens var. hirtella TaxID=608512 RepID=A0AAD4P0C5_PERFH|nr:Leucine-rich receptor-like protein kinase family protein [Perilla frutescens var. hirtella]